MEELKPIYTEQKTFHKKAWVKKSGNEIFLYSYGIIVAKIIKYKNIAEVYQIRTDSTLRHVMEFLKQSGFKAESKKQIIEDYFIKTV